MTSQFSIKIIKVKLIKKNLIILIFMMKQVLIFGKYLISVSSFRMFN